MALTSFQYQNQFIIAGNNPGLDQSENVPVLIADKGHCHHPEILLT